MKNMLMSVTLASAVALLSQCAAAENVTYHLEDLDLSWMMKRGNKNLSTDSKSLLINETPYTTGVGTHAESHYLIVLNGKGVSFKAKGGLDDEQRDENGTPRSNGVIFKVVNLDNNSIIATTGVVEGKTDAVSLKQVTDNSETINLAGIQKIDLVVDPNGGNDWDHADWVETELVCSEAIFPNETKRLWNPTESGKSITDGAAWFPTFTGGYPTHCDFFAINSETPAALSVGESFAAKKLRVGYGVTLNDSGDFVQDAASDLGAVFNMTGGTLDVIDELFVGAGYADNRDCIMNVTGGKVSAGKLIMGECASNGGKYNGLTIDGAGAEMELNFGESTLSPFGLGNSKIEIKNGGKLTSKSRFNVGASGSATVTVEGKDSSFKSSGDLYIAQGSSARGVVHVKSGTLEAGNHICVGENGFGTLTVEGTGSSFKSSGNLHIAQGSSARGVVHVVSGALEASDRIYVGDWGFGTLTVEGTDSSFKSFGNLHIAQESSATGVVHVVSGTLQAGNDIYVGNKGFGTLTIDGGTVSCTHWLDFNREEGSSSEHGGVVNLNGGVLNVGKIHSARGPSTFNWNGGTYKPNGNYYSDCFEAFEGLTVNVLARGAVLDTSSCFEKGKESIIASALAGSGFLKKTGSGTGELRGSVDLRRGFIVEEGTLKITGTIASTATTPLKEISVADGASLDLNEQTVHVLAYKVAGIEQEAGTYSEQKGTIIVIDADTTPVSAVWTNGAGDGDVDNAANWETRNEDGVVVYDVLPTDSTVVTIPYEGRLENLGEFNSAETILSVSGAATLAGFAAAPVIAKSAVGWYDASDRATLTVADDGTVNGIDNKGSSSVDLDLVLAEPDKARQPSYDPEKWSLNGLPVIAFTNAYGFASKDETGIASSADKTIMVVSRHQCNTFHKYNDSGAETGEYYNEMMPLGIESTSTNDDGFRIEDCDWGWRLSYWDEGNETDKFRELGKGSITARDLSNNERWQIWDMGIGNKVVQAHCWDSDTGHLGTSASETISTASERTDNRIYLGYRKRYSTSSSGFIAEAFVFDKALAEGELAAMRDYLQQKWFSSDSVSTLPESLRLESGASLDLNGRPVEFAKVYGGGTLSNGAATITDALVVTVNDDGTIEPLAVDGALVIGENARLVVKNARKLVGTNPVVALSATEGITGAFASAVSDPEGLPLRSVKSADGKSITIARRGGLRLTLR